MKRRKCFLDNIILLEILFSLSFTRHLFFNTCNPTELIYLLARKTNLIFLAQYSLHFHTHIHKHTINFNTLHYHATSFVCFKHHTFAWYHSNCCSKLYDSSYANIYNTHLVNNIHAIIWKYRTLIQSYCLFTFTSFAELPLDCQIRHDFH